MLADFDLQGLTPTPPRKESRCRRSLIALTKEKKKKQQGAEMSKETEGCESVSRGGLKVHLGSKAPWHGSFAYLPEPLSSRLTRDSKPCSRLALRCCTLHGERARIRRCFLCRYRSPRSALAGASSRTHGPLVDSSAVPCATNGIHFTAARRDDLAGRRTTLPPDSSWSALSQRRIPLDHVCFESHSKTRRITAFALPHPPQRHPHERAWIAGPRYFHARGSLVEARAAYNHQRPSPRRPASQPRGGPRRRQISPFAANHAKSRWSTDKVERPSSSPPTFGDDFNVLPASAGGSSILHHRSCKLRTKKNRIRSSSDFNVTSHRCTKMAIITALRRDARRDLIEIQNLVKNLENGGPSRHGR